ncbi:DUF362 domain-containing protein [candidate division KSB1 bacterium]
MVRSKVAVLKTEPDTVLEDIDRLCSLADDEEILSKSSTTILKTNISWHYFYPSSNTTPWQLEGVIQRLFKIGCKDITAVENDTVVTNTVKGERLNKFIPVFDKYKIPRLYNYKESDITWETYKTKEDTPALNKIYPEGFRIPSYFIGKNIVHLPTVKTHIYTTTTGAMKNAFGGLLNTKRHYTHSLIHQTLVDLLRVQKDIHSGIFAVMDGTTAGSGPGPRTLVPFEKDYILASSDQVAIDAVAAKMMGFDPLKIEYINLAHQAGLGVGDVREIEITGEDISNVNFGFSVGDNLASRFGDLLWFSALRNLQKLFFHTPLVNLFVLGSFLYHDYYWYPLKGKKAVDDFLSTKWGKLFATY